MYLNTDYTHTEFINIIYRYYCITYYQLFLKINEKKKQIEILKINKKIYCINKEKLQTIQRYEMKTKQNQKN